MGLREDAEKIQRDAKQEQEKRKRDYASAALAAVPGALQAWCRSMGIEEVPDYTVKGVNSGSWAWESYYFIMIEFVLDGIPFTGDVHVGDDPTHGNLQAKVGSTVITNMADLGRALDP